MSPPPGLKWSQDSKENWNGKRGQYTLMVVANHGGQTWHVHPKLPGVKGEQVASAQEGMLRGNFLFLKWLTEVQ
jgi:hypothetical protein